MEKMWCVLSSSAVGNMAMISSSVFAFIAIIANLITTNKQLKESKALQQQQKEQYDESLRVQKEQYEKELQHARNVETIKEKPYLVFDKAKIAEESDDKITRIDVMFKNKGRGSAYDIVPVLKCKVKTLQGDGVLSRCDAIQDHIAMVGETFKTMWTLGYGKELSSFMTTISINYKDASGRKYIQKYDIIFNEDGYASITNYARPELCI